MSIFSDMIRDIVKEEMKNALEDLKTPEPAPTPDPEPTPEPEPKPTVTPAPTPAPAPAFDMNAFRAELKNDLSKLMADAVNGEVVSVEEINPDEALKAILGFDK